MRNHTPGPRPLIPTRAQADAFKDARRICRMFWPTTERSEAETEANAALIASAPDLLAEERDRLREVNAALLAALELALKYWADRQQRYKNRNPVWVQCARAAIAKAKGGAA